MAYYENQAVVQNAGTRAEGIMARVIQFHKTGGPEVLQIDEVDIGAPGRGELRLRVHAFGLNRAEAMFRSGMYLEEPKLPGRLGYEAAGTVEAIGEGVAGFAIGDKVSTIPAFSMSGTPNFGSRISALTALSSRPISLSAAWIRATPRSTTQIKDTWAVFP